MSKPLNLLPMQTAPADGTIIQVYREGHDYPYLMRHLNGVWYLVGDNVKPDVTNMVGWTHAGVQEAPTLHIKCEVTDGEVVGVTSLDVIRVETNDDGSFTAVTNHWPRDSKANLGVGLQDYGPEDWWVKDLESISGICSPLQPDQYRAVNVARMFIRKVFLKEQKRTKASEPVRIRKALERLVAANRGQDNIANALHEASMALADKPNLDAD